MTKGEISFYDSCLFGPIMLLLDQYLNFVIPEYYVLWVFLVSFFHSFLFLDKNI
jgi:hypothetical protein